MDARDLKHLGRYEIVQEIGRGAMGIVYLATDPVIGRTLAAKTVAPPPGIDPERYREFLGRFAREAQAAGGLSHPGIVTVYDAGYDAPSGLSYIAMEYVRGGTLEDRVRRQDPDRQDGALRVGREIAAALAYAHGRGIVHRDLKPANVLLGEDGAAKITDFGVARLETSDLTREGQSLGSPAYMSPEQALGRAADRRSDLFSLGIILYEMLTGERPFKGADASALAYQIVHEPPIPLRALDRRISPFWEAIVQCLLAKRPEERYDDAQQLLEDLDRLAAGAPPRHAPPLADAVERTVVDGAPGDARPVASAPIPDTGPADAASARHLSLWELAAEIAVRLGAAGARILLQIRTRVAPRVASASARVLALTGALLARISPRLVAGARSRVVPACVLCLVPAAAIAGWLVVRPGCLVAVDLRHGLEQGRLQVFVDGAEVVNRSFHGESRGMRIFGQELVGRTGGRLEDSFRARAGVHDIMVVVDAGNEEPWSRTIRRTLEAGSRSVLEVRAASGFTKELGVGWDSEDDD